MEILNIIGVVFAGIGVIATIAVPVALHRLNAKKPKVSFECPGNGTLSRCLTKPVFDEGWGVFSVSGKLRVSNRPVTVVDAKLTYKMDSKHVRPSNKKMGDDFPPLAYFPRIANDERGSICAPTREGFTTIKLIPGEGEQAVRVHFILGGNFSSEYSRDFFERKFSTVGSMFIPMMIRFQYEDNGKFHWTEDYSVLVYPFSNMGWTSQGLKYIDEQGKLIEVFHTTPVYGVEIH